MYYCNFWDADNNFLYCFFILATGPNLKLCIQRIEIVRFLTSSSTYKPTER